ncbi:MAG TPA: helix-turn-helix domain-containing protein [Chitinophagaceae bacterium]|nr:helix-turn-helix domain-containing protein [Chitinophagaceae bacterium]
MTEKIIFTSLGIEELRSLIVDSVSSELKKQLATSTSTTKSDRLLSRQETARLLNVSTSTLLSYVKQGRIKSFRIGRRVLFKQADIEAAMKLIITDPLLIQSNDRQA